VRGGTLKHLKIVLPVEVLARRRDVLTVTDLVKTAGKTFAGDDGVRLNVKSVNVFGPNLVQMQLAVSVPAGQSLDANKLGLRLTDAKGGEHQPLTFNMNLYRQNVREPEAEDLLWLSGSLQGGFLAQLPWAGLAPGTRKLNRLQWTGFAQFSSQEAIGAPAKLTLFRFERLRTELPFEFHDLPLP